MAKLLVCALAILLPGTSHGALLNQLSADEINQVSLATNHALPLIAPVTFVGCR
eukprot:COSAG05_NODE_1942_length_3800_cov_1.897595_2_plen_54_part_00